MMYMMPYTKIQIRKTNFENNKIKIFMYIIYMFTSGLNYEYYNTPPQQGLSQPNSTKNITFDYNNLPLETLVKIRKNSFMSKLVDYLLENNKTVKVTINDSKDILAISTPTFLTEEEADKIPIDVNLDDEISTPLYRIYFTTTFMKDGHELKVNKRIQQNLNRIITAKYVRELKNFIEKYQKNSSTNKFTTRLDNILNKRVSQIVDDITGIMTPSHTYLDENKDNYIHGTYGHIKRYYNFTFANTPLLKLQQEL